MIRLALPKGRNQAPVVAAFAAAGIALPPLDDGSRRLWRSVPEAGLELLLLKDHDLPLYVARGVADGGFVGRDVLDEVDGDLLVPLELAGGASRLAFIGPVGTPPPSPGAHVRVATKFPRLAARWIDRQPWSAEILELSSSLELAPLVGLADFVVDVVETGATLRAHDLVELATIAPVRPCFVVHRSAWQIHRRELAALVERLAAARVPEGRPA